MLKRLMGLAVLSGVIGGGVMAMQIDREDVREDAKVDNAKVEAAIDGRLHQLLVEMRLKHALR